MLPALQTELLLSLLHFLWRDRNDDLWKLGTI